MLFLLLAHSLSQGGSGEAGPIPVSLERRDVASCSGEGSQRTMYGIVWSCLTTIFLCTWLALHPNIAFRPEKPKVTWSEWRSDPLHKSEWIWDPLYHFLSYKLPLFLCALLFPEYILLWAVRQYSQAGMIKESIPAWTRTHGFFVIMGGFHLFRLPNGARSVPLPLKNSPPSGVVTPSGNHVREDEVPICPLSIYDLPPDVFMFIAPTEAQIKDKGKSDELTTLIVLVQTLWFVIQCITRGIQHLRLTELEVVTLAYAILNFFIYLIWWNKPRNIERPIRVYESETDSHKSNEEVNVPCEWPKTPVIRQMYQVFAYFLGEQENYIDISKQSSVPMFWSSGGGLSETNPILVGATFGAFHFIAWSYEFPSHAEFVIWRICCVAMVGFPSLMVAMWSIFIPAAFKLWEKLSKKLFKKSSKKSSENLPEEPSEESSPDDDAPWLTIGVSCLFILLYIVSKMATLVLAFTTLRSLPPSALDATNWTYFIPHL